MCECKRQPRFIEWAPLAAFGFFGVVFILVIVIPLVVLMDTECQVDADCGCPSAPISGSDALCNTATYSMTCENSCCKKGPVVLAPLENGVSCEGGKVCQTGECVVDLCPGCKSDLCQVSTCVQGECHSEPRNDNLECQSDMCSRGVCKSGVCALEPKCKDGNFCTLDRCHDGDCEFLPILNSQCGGFCKNGCPNGFFCVDGLCMQLQSMQQQLKFVDHTFHQCESDSYRLVLHFRMFSDSWNATVGTGVSGLESRYLVPLVSKDFMSTTDDLGFIDYVVEHQVQIKGEYAETSFSLTTSCVDLSEMNCHEIFARRDYGFRVILHDCDKTLNCIESVEVVSANMHLSVNNCPLDEYNIVIEQLNTLKIMAESTNWTNANILQYDDTARVLLETPGFDPWIRSARLCVPREHRNKACVINENATDCPVRGCYGWSEDDSPVERFIDIFVDGWATASVRGGSYIGTHITACRDFDHYPNMTCAECGFQCCSPECNGCSDFDGFDFKLSDFLQPGDTGVFDVKFEARLGCYGEATESRAVSHLTI